MLYIKHSDTNAEATSRHVPKNATVKTTFNSSFEDKSSRNGPGKGPGKGLAVVNSAHASAHKSLKAMIDRDSSVTKTSSLQPIHRIVGGISGEEREASD